MSAQVRRSSVVSKVGDDDDVEVGVVRAGAVARVNAPTEEIYLQVVELKNKITLVSSNGGVVIVST